MKKPIIIVAVIVVIIAAVVGIVMISNKGEEKKETKGIKIETAQEMQDVLKGIYEKLEEELPALDIQEVNLTDELAVTSYTGLKSVENVETLVVSEPFMNSQAYSAVLVKVSDNANIEDMKKEMFENIDTRKWICVQAEQLYVTNCGNVIFLIMADSDWATPVYNEFKEAVDGNIGKELQKTEEI